MKMKRWIGVEIEYGFVKTWSRFSGRDKGRGNVGSLPSLWDLAFEFVL